MANSIVALKPLAASASWNVNTANSLLDYDVASSILRVGDSAIGFGKNGTLYLVNAITGQVGWSRYLGAPVGSGAFASPTYWPSGNNGTIIVPAGYLHNPDTYNGKPGGQLYGISPGGAVRWRIQSNYAILGYAALTPDLAFTPIDTNMVALDPFTGKVLWSYPSWGYHYSSPVIVPSGLFFADLSGRLYAFGLPSSGPAQKSAQSRAAILEMQRRFPPVPHVRPKFCKLK
jgi:outer membrane protein assembly factor BamB